MQEAQEAQVQSLGCEDRLEEEMATHSNILAWETPWTEHPGRATIHRVTKEWETTEHRTAAARAREKAQ